MTYLISILFITEFLLIALIFFYLLFNKGFTFKGGVAFSLMYFIFIPIWVLIITGKVEIGHTSFSATKLNDVILKTDVKSSFTLLAYIFSIILYLYLGVVKERNSERRFNLKIGTYLFFYLIPLLIIFLGAGMLKGGNWYDNRNSFFKEIGSIAVMVSFLLTASRILIIASLFYMNYIKKLSMKQFILLAMIFTIFDMVLSGNRIYFFITFVIIGLYIVKKYPLKTIFLFPFAIPIVAYVAYFGSIFRHIRGPLFKGGFPTGEVFMASLKRAMILEPFDFSTFFLNISESVNINVIYNIFSRYDNVLYGATYLKTLFFYIPRSLWGGKPESITVLAANKFGSASLVTTIIGEMQMNFSYFGILLIPIFLWLSEYIIKYFSIKNYFYSIIAFIFGVLIFRMPYSDEMIVFMFIVLILYFSNLKWKIAVKDNND